MIAFKHIKQDHAFTALSGIVSDLPLFASCGDFFSIEHYLIEQSPVLDGWKKIAETGGLVSTTYTQRFESIEKMVESLNPKVLHRLQDLECEIMKDCVVRKPLVPYDHNLVEPAVQSLRLSGAELIVGSMHHRHALITAVQKQDLSCVGLFGLGDPLVVEGQNLNGVFFGIVRPAAPILYRLIWSIELHHGVILNQSPPETGVSIALTAQLYRESTAGACYIAYRQARRQSREEV